jgi:hypothetical protein
LADHLSATTNLTSADALPALLEAIESVGLSMLWVWAIHGWPPPPVRVARQILRIYD